MIIWYLLVNSDDYLNVKDKSDIEVNNSDRKIKSKSNIKKKKI
jgi:hypothetical protein